MYLFIKILLTISVAQAYLNQKKLDAEAKQLHQSAIVFSKQTSQWLSLIDNFNSALKELGDVENWTRTIENDICNITTTLEYAYKGDFFFKVYEFVVFTDQFIQILITFYFAVTQKS